MIFRNTVIIKRNSKIHTINNIVLMLSQVSKSMRENINNFIGYICKNHCKKIKCEPGLKLR